MRNLKKVLALALATVMLLGIMAIASAADYTDEAAIADKYAVAVDVMTAIGVFEGDPAGNFNPAAKLTREQAAKIAVYVALTKDTAKHVTAVEDPFNDVAAARWSAGSIVAAKNLGLIDGWDGKFDPTGDLTGYAFAKMMLGVLGYKAADEGFLGSGWEFNVNMAAAKAGLLTGLDASKMALAMTREEAAQMALNALKAQPVKYEGGSSVSINGVTITTGAQKEAETYIDVNDNNTTKTYATLAQKLYPTLTWNTKVDNDFGYATIQYKYGATPAVVATAKNYEVLKTYTGDLTALTDGALYTLTNKTTTALPVYVNGADTTTVTPVKDGTAKQLAAYTGAVVEVVKNDGKYEVLISQAEVDQVDAVVAAAGEAKRKITIGDLNYETENFAKDEYVFVWKNATKILKVAAIADADVVTGTTTQVDGNNGTAITGIYLDGTKYAVAGTLADDTVAFAKEYNVYFQNGYAIYAKQVDETVEKATIASYVYVTKQDTDPVNPDADTAFGAAASGKPSYYETQVVFLIDGTAAIVKAAGEVDAGKVYEMDENTDGLKTFKATGTDLAIVELAGDIVVADTTKYYDVANDVRVYFTANTKVMTLETKADGFYKAATLAAPAKSTMDKAFFVYSFNTTAKVYEIERIVTPVVAAAAQDLYYVVGTLLGTTYDATAKASYDLYTAYDLATGDKLTVKVAKDAGYASGFYAATITNGVYAFSGASAVTAEYDAAAKALSVYNDLLTAKNLFTDLEVGKVTVVDAKGGDINTIAALVAKSNEGTAGKAVEFHTVTVSDKLTYIVVTKY